MKLQSNSSQTLKYRANPADRQQAGLPPLQAGGIGPGAQAGDVQHQVRIDDVIVQVVRLGRTFDCSFAVNVYDAASRTIRAQRTYTPLQGEAWLLGTARDGRGRLLLRFMQGSHEPEEVILRIDYRRFSIPLLWPRLRFVRMALASLDPALAWSLDAAGR
ncbi:hypothetical protein [Burkholderia sp. Ax-1719]|uniref:hypothetical protein n=1 Tax=Burkholderia sp. Ax-1719 TaxID=2608334 RepID=UPI00141F84A7|nr:hypothetical protein [Burkholderia sp. Ax-1719]NIE64138.1 hypothetical protein [Burkholderia sp. Ax-1719]